MTSMISKRNVDMSYFFLIRADFCLHTRFFRSFDLNKEDKGSTSSMKNEDSMQFLGYESTSQKTKVTINEDKKYVHDTGAKRAF